MKKLSMSIIQLFHQIRNDPMLLTSCFAPIIVGLVIKFGIPYLEKGISYSFSKYYLIFDLFLSIMAPILMCFAFAMITLEEIDDNIARYFSITPLGKSGYLLTRLGLPALLSMLMGFLVLVFCALSELSLLMKICLSILGAIQAIIVSLMIITLSTNKLEGMAITKLAVLTLLGLPVPFFITNNLQFAAAFLPSFWVAKSVQSTSFIFLIPALVVAALWYGFLKKRLTNKLAR